MLQGQGSDVDFNKASHKFSIDMALWQKGRPDWPNNMHRTNAGMGENWEGNVMGQAHSHFIPVQQHYLNVYLHWRNVHFVTMKTYDIRAYSDVANTV